MDRPKDEQSAIERAKARAAEVERGAPILECDNSDCQGWRTLAIGRGKILVIREERDAALEHERGKWAAAAWIPVEERLPSERGKYLWQGKDGKFHFRKFSKAETASTYTNQFVAWIPILLDRELPSPYAAPGKENTDES